MRWLTFIFTPAATTSSTFARACSHPLDGVPEDPATGSASCALAGLLCAYSADANSSARWRTAQGVEMGRPSVLVARAENVNGAVVATWVAGISMLVADGWIDVG